MASAHAVVSLPRAYSSPGFYVANASASPWPKMKAGIWEPYTFELLDCLLSNHTNAIFVDVGAFVGPLSLYAASLNATVFAAEADVDNFASLLANVAANPLSLRRRLSTHLLAIAKESGIAVMSKPARDEDIALEHRLTEQDPSAVSIMESVRNSGHADDFSADPLLKREEWTVPTMGLHTYLQHILSVASGGPTAKHRLVLSMDIEGAEIDALQAAFPLLSSMDPVERPPLILEMHPGFFALEGGSRARYVASTSRVLSLYSGLYFLGRDDKPRCQPGAEKAEHCHWPAVLAKFTSVHHLASFMTDTTQEAFMLHASNDPALARSSIIQVKMSGDNLAHHRREDALEDILTSHYGLNALALAGVTLEASGL
uniref:Methyltransferase FkbM domain-containing protein n=1 Tax=Chrysotila carterae TaxID=13221 RepID=A0A7S4C0X8_CHRCT